MTDAEIEMVIEKKVREYLEPNVGAIRKSLEKLSAEVSTVTSELARSGIVPDEEEAKPKLQ